MPRSYIDFRNKGDSLLVSHHFVLSMLHFSHYAEYIKISHYAVVQNVGFPQAADTN